YMRELPTQFLRRHRFMRGIEERIRILSEPVLLAAQLMDERDAIGMDVHHAQAGRPHEPAAGRAFHHISETPVSSLPRRKRNRTMGRARMQATNRYRAAYPANNVIRRISPGDKPVRAVSTNCVTAPGSATAMPIANPTTRKAK